MELASYKSAVKTFRHHRCRRTHRTYRALVHCALPRVASVAGEGAYAVVAWCGPGSIQLYENPYAASVGLGLIDPCGDRCRREHEIIKLRK